MLEANVDRDNFAPHPQEAKKSAGSNTLQFPKYPQRRLDELDKALIRSSILEALASEEQNFGLATRIRLIHDFQCAPRQVNSILAWITIKCEKAIQTANLVGSINVNQLVFGAELLSQDVPQQAINDETLSELAELFNVDMDRLRIAIEYFLAPKKEKLPNSLQLEKAHTSVAVSSEVLEPKVSEGNAKPTLNPFANPTKEKYRYENRQFIDARFPQEKRETAIALCMPTFEVETEVKDLAELGFKIIYAVDKDPNTADLFKDNCATVSEKYGIQVIPINEDLEQFLKKDSPVFDVVILDFYGQFNVKGQVAKCLQALQLAPEAVFILNTMAKRENYATREQAAILEVIEQLEGKMKHAHNEIALAIHGQDTTYQPTDWQGDLEELASAFMRNVREKEISQISQLRGEFLDGVVIHEIRSQRTSQRTCMDIVKELKSQHAGCALMNLAHAENQYLKLHSEIEHGTQACFSKLWRGEEIVDTFDLGRFNFAMYAGLFASRDPGSDYISESGRSTPFHTIRKHILYPSALLKRAERTYQFFNLIIEHEFIAWLGTQDVRMLSSASILANDSRDNCRPEGVFILIDKNVYEKQGEIRVRRDASKKNCRNILLAYGPMVVVGLGTKFVPKYVLPIEYLLEDMKDFADLYQGYEEVLK